MLMLSLNTIWFSFYLFLNPPTDFCHFTDDEGFGDKFIVALYYDATNDQCSPFIYKGEGGNGNVFLNERECMRNCSANVHSSYPANGEIRWRLLIGRFVILRWFKVDSLGGVLYMVTLNH